MEKLKTALRFGGILSEESIGEVLRHFEEKHLRPNDHFQQQDKTASRIGFISEGVLRVYSVTRNDEEVTKYFVRQNQFAVNLESYYNGLPSDTAMQAVVPTSLMLIKKTSIEKLSTDIPNFYIFIKSLTEAHLLNKIKDNDFLNYGSAKEKYLEFIKRYPDLALQVPQQHIASYLKITPQSLSRIRHDLSKK